MYAASGKNVKTAATKMVAYERIRNTDNTFGKQKKLMLNATIPETRSLLTLSQGLVGSRVRDGTSAASIIPT
jgi:hypothetical protein